MLTLGLSSCDQKQNQDNSTYTYTKFPATYSIKNPETISTIKQLVPWKIFAIDSMFMIYVSQGNEYFFHLYDDEFSFMGSFGKKGHGPGEFSMAEYCGQYYKDDSNKIKVWVHDQGTFMAYKLDLSRALNAAINDDSFIEEVVYLPEEVLTMPEFIAVDTTGLFLGRSDMVSEGRYFTFSSTDPGIEWTTPIPDVEEFTVDENLTLAYHSTTRFDKKNNRVISAMTHFERIDIFDNEMNLFRTIVRDNGNPAPDFLSANHPFQDGNYNYYIDLCLNDQYIFASSLNVPFSILKHQAHNGHQNMKGYVHVFHLDGTPVAELQFEHAVSRFTVDRDNMNIFIFNYEHEDMPLLKYDLPDFEK